MFFKKRVWCRLPSYISIVLVYQKKVWYVNFSLYKQKSFFFILFYFVSLSEREGFEPSVILLLHRRSRSIPSTTRTSFHRKYDTDKLKLAQQSWQQRCERFRFDKLQITKKFYFWIVEIAEIGKIKLKWKTKFIVLLLLKLIYTIKCKVSTGIQQIFKI